MSSTEILSNLGGFDFIQIHSLCHRFSHPSTPEHEKQPLAEKALSLMDKHQALHPSHQQMCQFLLSQGSEQSARFGEEWILAIKDYTTTSILKEEGTVFSDKEGAFQDIVPLLKSLFLRADFHMLEYYLNKLLSTQFSSTFSNEGSLAKNRYFEFAFYQMICILYGQFWFHDLNVSEDPDPSNSSSSDALNWTMIEKKVDSFHASCENESEASPSEVSLGASSSDLEFYWANKWFCAFITFKENRFNEFVQRFDALKPHLAVLESLQVHSEALILYAIASIATKSFKDLNFSAEDHLLDCFTSSPLVISGVYELLDQLLMGNFVEAKHLLNAEGYVQTLDSVIAYALPHKTVGTFWDALEVIIDLKVFLLIMSMTKYIPREKMLDMMGYVDAEPSVKESVSNKTVLLLSVLNLNKSNVFYDQVEDRFCNLAIYKDTQISQLEEQLTKVEHTIKAEALATQMRGLLVSNFFKDLKQSQD